MFPDRCIRTLMHEILIPFRFSLRQTIFSSMVLCVFLLFSLIYSAPPRYGPPTRTDYRLVVENLSSRVSWQVSRYLFQLAEIIRFDDDLFILC